MIWLGLVCFVVGFILACWVCMGDWDDGEGWRYGLSIKLYKLKRWIRELHHKPRTTQSCDLSFSDLAKILKEKYSKSAVEATLGSSPLWGGLQAPHKEPDDNPIGLDAWVPDDCSICGQSMCVCTWRVCVDDDDKTELPEHVVMAYAVGGGHIRAVWNDDDTEVTFEDR